MLQTSEDGRASRRIGRVGFGRGEWGRGFFGGGETGCARGVCLLMGIRVLLPRAVL